MQRSFPVSDHCDGQHFFNPGPTRPARGLAQVLRWRFSGVRSAWPEQVTDPVYTPPPTAVTTGQIALSFINHATFLLRLPGAVVLTDPIFSLRCSPVGWAGPSRVRPPGISLADLPRPDVVVLSHNHYDHMDLPSLRTIQQRFAPRFVTTLGNAAPLRRLGIEATELDWWQTVTVNSLHITVTPARHFAARTPWDRNRTLWGGFMMRDAFSRILFAGDSGAGTHWHDIRTRLGSPDLALLPIGAYEPRWFMADVHMNPAEAVQAHVAIGARQSIGMHYGTFQLTDEAIDAPLNALSDALRTANLTPRDFTTLGFGETLLYDLG